MFFLILKFIAPSTLRASVTTHHETNFLVRKLKANWSDNKSWTTSSTCLSETPESRLSSSRFGPKKVQKRSSSSFAKLHFLLKETLIYLPRFPPKKIVKNRKDGNWRPLLFMRCWLSTPFRCPPRYDGSSSHLLNYFTVTH